MFGPEPEQDGDEAVAEPPEQAFAHVTPENAGEMLFVRSERQTLRKLPATGAVVFTIGVYVAPLGSLSPGNVTRIAEAGRLKVAVETGVALLLTTHKERAELYKDQFESKGLVVTIEPEEK